MLQRGQLGVHPPGALGVAFFIHAQAECFIGRTGDGITDLLKKGGTLNLQDGDKLRSVSLSKRVFANLLEADALAHMPELLMICCNPDQLGLLTGELTRFVENLAQRGRLETVDDIRRHVPILLILPNGILSERTLRTYEEQLHEAVLMQRLPGVTEPMVAVLLDRVIRGVSLQAGGRRGSGKNSVYLLERKGSLVFAGGGKLEQSLVSSILLAHGYPFKHIEGVPGTRIEFDKAMISIVLNVGGLIHMVKPDGSLIDLRMGDLCEDSCQAEFLDSMTRAVFEVGKAAGAYPEDAKFDDVWAAHRATIMAHAGHVTSSVKQFRDALERGLDTIKLFSNEEWILSPLATYAANAGMTEEEALFKSLGRQVQASMARAIRYRDEKAGGGKARGSSMRLTAQRNIGIELYESGLEEMVLVGTMLDIDHLIKLEITVCLPDEQITRSKLEMIRAPFPVCHEVESVAERLVGLRIERGVVQEIGRRIGGREGCSHIKELATSIVYFMASHLARRRAVVDPTGALFSAKSPDERFVLTKELLQDSCLAYCQTTAQGLDDRIGIKRVGEDHTHPQALGDYEPSLGVLLRDRAERWGQKTYLRYRRGDALASMSFDQFADTTFQIARHLMELGIGPGDRLAVISENRPEMFMFEMAVMSIGAATVPIFAGYPGPQAAYVLRHARPCMLVVSGNHQLEKIEKDKNPWIKNYLCIDFDAQSSTWGALDFASLTQTGGVSPEALSTRMEAVRPDDLCMVMYTSGTTGPPKGVQLCHRNIISQQKAISLIWDVSERDVLTSYLPWHHSFGGLFERFMTLYNGFELCIDDSRGRNLDRLIENWRAFNPTAFFSVPRVHDALLTRCRENAEVADAVFGGRLRFVFTAGAPLPSHIEAAYREKQIPVLEGWGLTETSPCVTVTTKDRSWRSGHVGMPLPGVHLRIDGDQQLLVKGPNVMAGYLHDEEATLHVINDDGWFHTGDLGEFTTDGLRIFGRKDGAFKLTTGEKVHPDRIESVFVNESPYISQMLVIGSGKDFVGALVYPDLARLREWAAEHGIKSPTLLDEPAVRELYSLELARINPIIDVKYHRVRRVVLADRDASLADGELTPSGKIVRKAVLASYKHKIDALFSSGARPEVIEDQALQLQRT